MCTAIQDAVRPGTMATFIDRGSGERIPVGMAFEQPQRRAVPGARVVGQPDQADVLAADVPVPVEDDLAGVGECEQP
jgi:hypothetical protein